MKLPPPDREALKKAAKAVEKFANGECSQFYAYEIAEVAVQAYMEDLLRQLDLPCKDCNKKEDHHGSDGTAASTST